MKLTRYEQETIINFSADDQTATLYTRDPVVMRQLDALVTEYPDIFKCIGETDIDKTYSMPKSRISYRKPRRISRGQETAGKGCYEKDKRMWMIVLQMFHTKWYNNISWRIANEQDFFNEHKSKRGRIAETKAGQ